MSEHPAQGWTQKSRVLKEHQWVLTGKTLGLNVVYDVNSMVSSYLGVCAESTCNAIPIKPIQCPIF